MGKKPRRARRPASKSTLRLLICRSSSGRSSCAAVLATQPPAGESVVNGLAVRSDPHQRPMGRHWPCRRNPVRVQEPLRGRRHARRPGVARTRYRHPDRDELVDRICLSIKKAEVWPSEFESPTTRSPRRAMGRWLEPRAPAPGTLEPDLSRGVGRSRADAIRSLKRGCRRRSLWLQPRNPVCLIFLIGHLPVDNSPRVHFAKSCVVRDTIRC
jgi:hypothetical protein